jgi:hypothetical protein
LISLIPSCEGWISREEDHVTPPTCAFRPASGAVSAGHLGVRCPAPVGRQTDRNLALLVATRRGLTPSAPFAREYSAPSVKTGPTICSTFTSRRTSGLYGPWTDYVDRAVATPVEEVAVQATRRHHTLVRHPNCSLVKDWPDLLRQDYRSTRPGSPRLRRV